MNTHTKSTRPSETDTDLAAFLDRLDSSDRVEVSDWEARFLESNLGRKHFTEPQRVVIRGLKERYAHKL